jgi:hypothetical protein
MAYCTKQVLCTSVVWLSHLSAAEAAEASAVEAIRQCERVIRHYTKDDTKGECYTCVAHTTGHCCQQYTPLAIGAFQLIAQRYAVVCQQEVVGTTRIGHICMLTLLGSMGFKGLFCFRI